jgi:DNA helicase II / ATP-dependent DNA helicase PcrA
LVLDPITLRPRMLNLQSLNPQQREAVETIRGPVLILAGAGTGKTRVITFRIAHMIARGISPANILGVTFTNKAAREMQERISKLIPAPGKKASEKGRRPTICTFHSLCVRILRQHIERLGYKRQFVIYSESDQLGAVRKVLSQFSAGGEKTEPKVVLALLSRLKNGGGTTGRQMDPGERAFIERVRLRYESNLRACNAVDFDDLILLTLKLFLEHPEALEACRQQFRYVMVDEYQDTNAAQFQLVQLLTSEHRNLCVVGDDDQSIYGWRGAEIANLLELENHFPEVKIIKLEQNYRSTNLILRAANALIKNNVRRRGKQLWSENGEGAKITLHTFQDDEEEALRITEEIEYFRQLRRIPWSEQAILFRTNLQSRPLETALRKAGIRYHLVGGQSFFDRREIKDFLSYLKMFLNPDDDISLLRVANVPARGLSDVTMERLLAASHERKCSVHSAMGNPVAQMTFPARTRESIQSFLELIARQRAVLHSHEPLNLSQWAGQFLEEIGYLDELRRGEKKAEAAENRWRNLRELAATLDQNGSAKGQPAERLHSFLEEITLDSERAEEKERTGEAVTLITMHSCKGLEFPHVFIVGLEDGILPHTRSKEEGSLDEERRLFYVAITRAQKSLTISYGLGRKKYGRISPSHPSPFLKELPSSLVEHAAATEKQPVTVETGKSLFSGLRAALE